MYQLSDLKLKIGYLIVSNKILAKKLFLIVLILTEVILISFSAVKLTRFYSSEKVEFEKSMSQILSTTIDYELYRKINEPKNILITELDSIALDKNKYNFIAKAHNPNEKKWIVKEVEYYFTYNDLKTDTKKTFILPGEKKYITSFGIESNQKIFKPKIIISSIQWKRIKKADEEKFANEVKKYINFEIKNAEYLNSYLLGIKDDDQISVIRFEAKNNTIFDYYEVGFYIATYNGPAITSINYFLANNILSEEQREIEVRWRDSISNPDKIVILPEINILDSSIVMSKDNIIGLPK